MGLRKGEACTSTCTDVAAKSTSTSNTYDMRQFVSVRIRTCTYSQLQLQPPGSKEEHAAKFGSHAKPGHHQFTLYVNLFDIDFDMRQRGEGLAET